MPLASIKKQKWDTTCQTIDNGCVDACDSTKSIFKTTRLDFKPIEGERKEDLNEYSSSNLQANMESTSRRTITNQQATIAKRKETKFMKGVLDQEHKELGKLENWGEFGNNNPLGSRGTQTNIENGMKPP